MEKFEQIFSYINEQAEKYEQNSNNTYLEGVLETLEETLDGKFELAWSRCDEGRNT